MEPNREAQVPPMFSAPPGYYPYPPPMPYYQPMARRINVLYFVETPPQSAATTITHSPHVPQPGYTKIYLGQLPLQITERDIA